RRLRPLPVGQATDEVVEGCAFVALVERRDARFMQRDERLVHSALECLLKHACDDFAVCVRRATQQLINLVLLWNEVGGCVRVPNTCADPLRTKGALAAATIPYEAVDDLAIDPILVAVFSILHVASLPEFSGMV